MTDIPRWPKISLLDDPDEEERAKRQLNESRRKRGLEPLYPESGFPEVPSFADLLFGGGKPIPLGSYRHEPEPEKPDPDPGFLIDPNDVVIKDATPGAAIANPQVAQAERPPATAEGKSADAAPTPDKESAAPPASGKPLSYEAVKELVRENNRSRLPDELIIALIYKESSFKPWERSTDPESSASGLMQITRRAWKVVHEKRLNYGENNSPNFDENVFEPATNIQRGTAYLQHRIDESRGDIERGLAGYGPPKEKKYVANIFDGAIALQQNPQDPIATLNQVYGRNPVRKR